MSRWGRLKQAPLFVLFCLCACAQTPPKHGLDLRPVSFEELPGWTKETVIEALPALRASCAAQKKKQVWTAPCLAIEKAMSEEETRQVLKDHFTPHEVMNQGDGLFTGYYEATLYGSKRRTKKFQTPLWARPKDLLTIDLGAFRDSWKGEKITGKIKGAQFVPYDNRAAIAQGSLKKRAKPLLWVNDPVDAFFLEIQGSGRVEMTDGSVVRVGYSAQNGHGYVPIGRVLAQEGAIERPVTMEKIRQWLAAHPQRRQEIFNQNPSSVFFRKSTKQNPVGAQGVELTPMRSLAVDPKYVPLGTPIWLATENHTRLVVAQDTGGAIKGAVRGDLFWGAGAEAERGAGEMQERGTYYLLLPKGVTP